MCDVVWTVVLEIKRLKTKPRERFSKAQLFNTL